MSYLNFKLRTSTAIDLIIGEMYDEEMIYDRGGRVLLDTDALGDFCDRAVDPLCEISNEDFVSASYDWKCNIIEVLANAGEVWSMGDEVVFVEATRELQEYLAG